MFFILLWKFVKSTYHFCQNGSKIIKAVATIQSVILVPLILVLLLLPYAFDRGKTIEKQSQQRTPHSLARYGQ